MVKVKTNPFSAFQPEIPTTTVSKKAPTSVHIVGPLDSHPPPGPLPTKKCVPVPPYCHFLKGLVGQAFFSSSPLCSCDDILHGHSVIIHSFCKSLRHESDQGAQYVLCDPFGKLWISPESFNFWWQGVETGVLPELDMEKKCLAIGNAEGKIFLLSSYKNRSYKDIIHPVPPPENQHPQPIEVSSEEEEEEEEAFPADEEDEQEKKDPNFILK